MIIFSFRLCHNHCCFKPAGCAPNTISLMNCSFLRILGANNQEATFPVFVAILCYVAVQCETYFALTYAVYINLFLLFGPKYVMKTLNHWFHIPFCYRFICKEEPHDKLSLFHQVATFPQLLHSTGLRESGFVWFIFRYKLPTFKWKGKNECLLYFIRCIFDCFIWAGVWNTLLNLS